MGLKRLRNQLVISHILPSLAIIPLLGFALLYVLETRFLVPNLLDGLEDDAILLARVTGHHAEIWSDPAAAQAMLGARQPAPQKRVVLLTPAGRLLASNSLSDATLLDQPVETLDLDPLRGKPLSKLVHPDPVAPGMLMDVIAPVMTPDQELLGMVRVTRHQDTVVEQLMQLYYPIALVLMVGLLLSTALGLLLALNIERPITRVTRTIHKLARGDWQEQLEENGADELRQLAGSVKYLVSRLHDMEQDRQHLLTNLIHELGRPLGAMSMSIQALQRGGAQDPQLLEDLLEGMAQQTAGLQRLLEDLSGLHDQILGTLELDRQPLQLSEWLPQILQVWQEAASAQGHCFTAVIPGDIPVLEADADRLAQVIGNLLSNAIRYTPAGGRISFSAGARGEAVWLRVQDTGPGIAPEEQARIFEPFYRGCQSGRVKQGMGLGLSIARDLVTAHNGRLEIESTPGHGSSFSVWIPYNPKP